MLFHFLNIQLFQILYRDLTYKVGRNKWPRVYGYIFHLQLSKTYFHPYLCIYLFIFTVFFALSRISRPYAIFWLILVVLSSVVMLYLWALLIYWFNFSNFLWYFQAQQRSLSRSKNPFSPYFSLQILIFVTKISPFH